MLLLLAWWLPVEGLLEQSLLWIGVVILVAVLVSPVLTELIAYPVGLLFWPEERPVPPPLFKLTAYYVKQGRFEDAIAEYEKILHYHPQESRAYEELIEVLAQAGASRQSAEKLRAWALRRLGPGATLEHLDRVLKEHWPSDASSHTQSAKSAPLQSAHDSSVRMRR